MDLTKAEMRLVITALNKFKEGWDGVNEEFVEDTKILIYKFENYLNRGENNGN
tara:strand:- start:6859 stop:7017 length:159 start_codon:yes stop_codon:yes gene_type:complete